MIDVPVFLTEPAYDGLYVCYVDNPALPAFTERKMLMKYQGEWTYPMSDQKYRGTIYGWIGPLPVLKKEHFFAKTSYDPPSPAGDLGCTVTCEGDTVTKVEYDL